MESRVTWSPHSPALRGSRHECRALGAAPPPAPPAEIEADRHALVALYIATDGANWVRNEGWLTDQPLSTWRGVFTNPEGRVSRLELQVNQLTGTLPPEIGDLTGLVELDVIHNQLTGPILPGLRRLESLKALRLSSNQLEGPIPSWLGELSEPHAARAGQQPVHGFDSA